MGKSTWNYQTKGMDSLGYVCCNQTFLITYGPELSRILFQENPSPRCSREYKKWEKIECSLLQMPNQGST